MPDETPPDELPVTQPAEDSEEISLSEQELDDISAGGGQPHMRPPGPTNLPMAQQGPPI
jgi:hypothetical protein